MCTHQYGCQGCKGTGIRCCVVVLLVLLLLLVYRRKRSQHMHTHQRDCQGWQCEAYHVLTTRCMGLLPLLLYCSPCMRHACQT